MACVVHVLNRSPTKIVKKIVPQEAWIGTPCSVSHFRTFGYTSYVHVPKQLRNTLDDSSEICIFLGYDEDSKAYKLYNSMNKNVIITRDVLFKEEDSWDGTIDMVVKVAIPNQKMKKKGILDSRVK